MSVLVIDKLTGGTVTLSTVGSWALVRPVWATLVPEMVRHPAAPVTVGGKTVVLSAASVWASSVPELVVEALAWLLMLPAVVWVTVAGISTRTVPSAARLCPEASRALLAEVPV